MSRKEADPGRFQFCRVGPESGSCPDEKSPKSVAGWWLDDLDFDKKSPARPLERAVDRWPASIVPIRGRSRR
jgi:hypothetical protein